MDLKKLYLMGLLAISIATPLQAQEEEDFDAPPPGVFEPSDSQNQEEETLRGGRFDRFQPSNNGRFGSNNDDNNDDNSRSNRFESRSNGPVNERLGGSKRSTPKNRPEATNFASAEPEDINNENFPELIDSFDFPNADIADVVKAISELTGKNFIIDSSLRGKITIIAPTQITVAEAYKAFLSALAMAGYTVVPSGKFLKIRSSRQANRDSIETYSGAYSPDTDQMITRIIHLKHISAEEIYRKLNILTSKDGEAKAYAPTNSLIVTDYGSRIQTIYKMLKQLDVPGFEEQLVVIPIRYAKAKDISELIDQIINKGEGSSKKGGSFTSGIRRFGNNDNASSGGSSAFSTVIPDERTNAVIVVGNRAGIEKIRNLVKKLDFQLNPEDAGGVYVYYMKYSEAKTVADILNGIAKDAAKDDKSSSSANNSRTSRFSRASSLNNNDKSGESAMFGSDVKISADESINALIVTANKQDYEVVKSLLSKIDIPRNQVNVETVIMEISSTKNNSRGVSILNFEKADGSSEAVSRSGFVGENISYLTDFTAKGGIFGFASGKDVTVNIGGSEQTVKSVMGLVTLLKGVTDVNILSTPNITAMDNVEAEIEVGENVPVSSSTTQNGTSSTTSVTREPITIKLKIKPRISPGSNSVQLEIQQTIKQLSNRQVVATNLASNAISTTERAVDTQITVNDGDTAVLGGLIRETEDISVNKVPLLGDIPVLGWLFKSKTVNREKANLVMFLTPKIIRTNFDNQKLVDSKLNDRIDFIKRNMGGKDPMGARAAKLNKNNQGNFLEVQPANDEVIQDIEPDLDSADEIELLENSDDELLDEEFDSIVE